ncbi:MULTISPECIES: hypothetical protein [unclassified Luteimonas]
MTAARTQSAYRGAQLPPPAACLQVSTQVEAQALYPTRPVAPHPELLA